MHTRIARVTTFVVTLLVVVLMGVPSTIAVQPEEPAPTSFTGWIQGLPQSDEEACGGEFERVGAVEQVREYRCESWIGTTDPRFTGTYIVVTNFDVRRGTVGAFEDGSLTVSAVTRRVENDDGAWEATPSVEAWWVGEANDKGVVVQVERTMPIETVVFTGEGGYKGLTAVVWLDPFIANADLSGVIIAGDPPPPPIDAR